MSSPKTAPLLRTNPWRIFKSSPLLAVRQPSRWFHTRLKAHNTSIGSRKQITTPLTIPARSIRFRFNSTNANNTPNPTPNLGSPESLSLSQRLKALSKEYGWTALGVYLALSALDFPFCFLAVQLLGPERVGRAEHAIIDTIRSAVQSVMPDLMQTQEEADASRKAAAIEKGGKASMYEDQHLGARS